MARKTSEPLPGSVDSIVRTIKFKKRKFKFSPKQKEFLDLLNDYKTRIVFMSGPAGTSKTYMSLYGCLLKLQEDWNKDILYVRSVAESADKGLGSLPGDIAEKFDPFLTPLYDKIDEIISAGDGAFLKQQEKICSVPINFLRGANWIDKLVVADEAQNFTQKELTTLITRLGHGTTLIICGDPMQSDINGKTGFKKIFDLFNDEESKKHGIYCFEFTEEDIVRDPLLKFIVKRLGSV